MLLPLLFSTGAGAEPEIHRCEQDDGTISFQEKPCEENRNQDPTDAEEAESDAPAAADNEFFDFVNPFDEPPVREEQSALPLPEPVSQDRATCEKAARDAIDEIDLEMRNTSYTREEGRAYLRELRQLTQQLRACKQL